LFLSLGLFVDDRDLQSSLEKKFVATGLLVSGFRP